MSVQIRGSRRIDTFNRSTPFIHKFETKTNKYVLDVNTGKILRVDDVVWEIIEDSCLHQEEVIERYTPRFTPEQVTAAYHEIDRARSEEGCFLNDRPRIALGLSRERVHDILKYERKMLVLDVTEKCNFKCAYCAHSFPRLGSAHDGMRDMTWETAQMAIDDFLQCHRVSEPVLADKAPSRSLGQTSVEVADRSVSSNDNTVHVGFYGGEPLLNFPLVKRCTEYILAKGKGKVLFGISTNGYLLKGEMADFLGAHDFQGRVSLDGPAAVHDRYRRITSGLPTHAVVLENLRAFIRKYPRQVAAVAATVARGTNPQEIHRYLSSVDWIPPTAMRTANLASPVHLEDRMPASIMDEFPGFGEAYERFKEHLIKGRLNLDIASPELDLQKAAFGGDFWRLHRNRWDVAKAKCNSQSCGPGGGGSRTFVSVTGEYYACERVPRTEMYRIGSVAMGIDKEKSYAMLKEFIESTPDECAQCWCVSMCAVGCHASVRDKDGFTMVAKNQACERVRSSLHKHVVDYCHVLERNPRAFDYLNSEPALA